jgi:hypothetical protein
MMDVTNELEGNARYDRAAAESGLASLLLGGVLVLTAMLMLHINLHMFHNPRAWSPGDVQPLRYVIGVGALALTALTGASLAFGIRGVLLAYRHRQTSALAWAGVMISTFAGILWIVALVNSFAVTDMLLRTVAFPRLLP